MKRGETMLGVRMPESEQEGIKTRCKRLGIPMSSYIRFLLGYSEQHFSDKDVLLGIARVKVAALGKPNEKEKKP